MRDTDAIAGPERKVSVTALVGETMAVQAVGTLSVLAIPALAPEVARTLGVPTSQAGYQVGLVYAAATLFSLFASSAVAAFGPCRTGQIAMILTALGSTAASIPHIWAIIAGSALLGASYGLINPAASELLIRHSPPSRRNLIFSLKQTGVPIGGMAAGLLGPPVALAFGWPAVLLLIAAAALVLAALSQRTRPVLDGPRRKAAGRKGPRLLHSLRVVAQSRKLLWLSLSSFCFAAVQLCVIAFLVALLVEDLGFSLVKAGSILAAAQTCGALGRVLWGVVADRLRDGMRVLFGLGLLMSAASLAALLFVPAWPAYLVPVPFLILGLSAAGWNGVYLSEVARHSPAHAISATTGAAMFFTFAGVVICPPVFSILHGILGSYILCYGPLAALSLAGALMIRAAGLGGKAG
jgi:predicted MFS family arabinose efflux permease